MTNASVLFLLLASSQLYAQSVEIDVFPDRSVSSDRTQILVAIDNPSDADIFCEYVNNFVIYRTSRTDNNLEEKITVQNAWIPGNFTRTFTVGADKTKSLRDSGLYPDAYIDVVKNDFLSSQTKCYTKPMDEEKKSTILRSEATFATVMKTLAAKGSVRLTNGDRYPFITKLEAGSDAIVIQVENNKPNYKINPTWAFELREDGSLTETYNPYVDQSGATEATYTKQYSPNSRAGHDRLDWIRGHLNLVATYDPQLENRSLREMLKGVLEKLSSVLADTNQNAAFTVFDGEKVPFFASQNWDAANSSASAGNAGKTLTVRLNNKASWAAAGIPLDKFLYVDLSAYKKLKFKARGSKRFSARVFLIDSNAGTESSQVKFEVDGDFKPYSIDLNALRSPDLDLKKSQAMIFAVSEPQDGSFALELDDIAFTTN